MATDHRSVGGSDPPRVMIAVRVSPSLCWRLTCASLGCHRAAQRVTTAEFHREITGKEYKHLRPGIETTFFDAKCVEVIAPFGNRIRFNEDLKAAPAT